MPDGRSCAGTGRKTHGLCVSNQFYLTNLTADTLSGNGWKKIYSSLMKAILVFI